MQTTAKPSTQNKSQSLTPIPFHESLVPFIRSSSSEDLIHIAEQLIMRTVIPANHDNIIAAINEKWGDEAWAGTTRPLEERRIRVVTHLLKQKQIALAVDTPTGPKPAA